MNQAGYLMLFKHDWKNNKNQQGSQNMKLTSLFRAEAEVPRSAGSMARRTSIRARADGGKFLNVYATQHL